MPEAPEIKYLSLYLKSSFSSNEKFIKITSNTKTIVNLPSILNILDVTAYGKVITIHGIDDNNKKYFVNIHLGITGWLLKRKPKIYKYILHFSNIKFYLGDQRRFSKIWITELPICKDIIEIFDHKFTKELFYKTIYKKKKNICAMLLDQKLFVGIGNYIKNDALFLARISPFRKCNELTETQIHTLHKYILIIAYSSLFTQCDYQCIPLPKNLSYKNLMIPYRFFVFDREKYKKYNVLFIKHFGRNTYYVDELQK